MQEERYSLGVIAENGKIYAMGGYTGGGPFLDTNEEYDPETNKWTTKTPMPFPMGRFGITVHNGKIYCISGENGTTYAYTPIYDTWEEKAPLPNPRYYIKANTINDKIYIVGGNTNSLDAYDPQTNTWTTMTPMPHGLGSSFYGWRGATAVLDGRIHVIGGTPWEYSHQIYDPTTDSWKVGKPLIAGYHYSFAVATTGVNSPKRIYVFGADKSDWHLTVPIPTGQSYDPKTVTWTLIENVPDWHIRGDGAVVDDKIYVVGGSMVMIGGGNFLARPYVSLYTPIGYGTPDYTYVPPDPTPTPTLSPIPTPTPTPDPEPEPFPTAIVLASVVIIAVVGFGILAYYKKYRKKETR